MNVTSLYYMKAHLLGVERCAGVSTIALRSKSHAIMSKSNIQRSEVPTTVRLYTCPNFFVVHVLGLRESQHQDAAK